MLSDSQKKKTQNIYFVLMNTSGYIVHYIFYFKYREYIVVVIILIGTLREFYVLLLIFTRTMLGEKIILPFKTENNTFRGEVEI